jgi:hypothetical protein
MNTIHHMARRVVATVKALSLAERPAKVEVEFGLKLDAAPTHSSPRREWRPASTSS